MRPIEASDKLQNIHSDIRGPVYEKSQEMRRAGIDILRLNTGNPATFGFKMPESVKKALLEHEEEAVAYCDARGMMAARQAIANYHVSRGIEGVTPDDVYIGNGVSEVAEMLCSSILNFGDELLMPRPSYSLWSNGALLAGAKPVFYTCDEKSNWYPDVADMEKLVTDKTKAVLLINPNNPTGQVYPPEVVQEVVNFAKRHDLLIISDEIYDRLIMDGMPYVSTASLCPDWPVVTTNGLSKSHLICGFRIGWLAISGPRELTKGLSQCINKLCALRLCGNALAQLVVPAALEDEASTRAMMSPGGRVFEQRNAACRALDELQEEGILSYNKPHAAFYVFPRIDDHIKIKNDRQMAFDLLESKHILLVAGSGFDWIDMQHFRLVLLPEPEELYKAVKDIGDFLRDYHQD